MNEDKILKINGLSIKFCGKNEEPENAKENFLPIMVHSCPDDFSTVDYFDVSSFVRFNL